MDDSEIKKAFFAQEQEQKKEVKDLLKDLFKEWLDGNSKTITERGV